MCSTCNARTCPMSAFQSSSVSPGKPNIRSMLMLPMPMWRSRFTASLTCREVCRRWRKRSRSSANVCAPMLMRLTGSLPRASTYSSVRSSGLHSIVTSSGARLPQRFSMASKSFFSRVAVSCDGVPPPRYTVSTFSSRFLCHES